MKYQVINFKIETPADLLQIARDLIADAAGEAGCESFEDYKDGIKGYVEQGQLDKSMLDDAIKNFPLTNTKIAYTIEEAEYKDWNKAWEEAGFDPIHVDNKVIIYDARQTIQNIPEGIMPVYFPSYDGLLLHACHQQVCCLPVVRPILHDIHTLSFHTASPSFADSVAPLHQEDRFC